MSEAAAVHLEDDRRLLVSCFVSLFFVRSPMVAPVAGQAVRPLRSSCSRPQSPSCGRQHPALRLCVRRPLLRLMLRYKQVALLSACCTSLLYIIAAHRMGWLPLPPPAQLRQVLRAGRTLCQVACCAQDRQRLPQRCAQGWLVSQSCWHCSIARVEQHSGQLAAARNQG